MPPTTTIAIRAAVRAAKAELTQAAIHYHAAVENHLRAIRAESRAVPVYLSLDSDQAIDALISAGERYIYAARRVDDMARLERRAIILPAIKEATR
jgi:hypothetical protein